MKIQPPQLPAQPQAAEDFLPLARRSIGEERPIEEILLRDCAAEGESMPKLEVRRCILEGCTFSGCDLSGAGFADVAFTDCNFSNCRLSDAYFSRCRFFGCKWLGAELDGAVYKIFAAVYTDTHTDKAPGAIVATGKDGIEVACGGGETVMIKELQAPGKKRMSAADFLRGHSIKLSD